MVLVKLEEKQISIDNLKINYKIMGTGGTLIILLHGWGINSDKYAETANQLFSQAASYKLQASIFMPDLPGFGKSDDPPTAWSVDDYVKLVRKFADNLKMNNFILIGHSFGGRIAIKFSAEHPEKVKALILTGAAGIKHPLTARQKTFYAAAKAGKVIFSLPLINELEKPAKKILYKAAREKDYFEAKGIMKEVFKNVAEDLTPFLDKIKAPTLLVWGKNDRSTPLGDAYIMKEKVANSRLEIVEDSNHSLPYQNPQKFAKIILEFINKPN